MYLTDQFLLGGTGRPYTTPLHFVKQKDHIRIVIYMSMLYCKEDLTIKLPHDPL